MEPKAHHILIGLFTVVTIAAILLFALWLGDPEGNRDYAWYEIGFKQRVSGLSEGSAVQYSGIEVGDVVELTLDPEDPSHVLALVRVYEDITVREDTRASLALANITGAMTIQFSGGKPGSAVLPGGSRDDPTYIAAEPSQFSALMSNSESLFQRADDFLTNANSFLSDENAEALTATLENLRIASDALVAEQDNLNQALVTVYDAAARAEDTFSRYEDLGNYLNQLLEEQGRPMLASARGAAESLAQATTRIDALVADNEGSVSQGLQSLGELGPVVHELQATLHNLRLLTQRLEEDPGKALLGQDPIQEVAP